MNTKCVQFLKKKMPVDTFTLTDHQLHGIITLKIKIKLHISMLTGSYKNTQERFSIFDGFFSSFLLAACLVAASSLFFRVLNERFEGHADVPPSRGVFWSLAAEISFDTIAEAATNSKIDTTTVSGIKLIQSAPSLVLGVRQKAGFEVGFKNTSKSSWRAQGSQKITLRSSAKRESYFHTATWESGTIIASLKKDVKPGEVIYFSFLLEAPSSLGQYTERMALYLGNEKVESSVYMLPIQVTATPQENVPLPGGVPQTPVAPEGRSLPT
ncbi:MAG: hypothetical protein Q7K40_01305, partial [bacterium]|nr:hypothetical protein [bacterium]